MGKSAIYLAGNEDQHSDHESANIRGTERSKSDLIEHMTTTQANALSLRDPWSLVPPLGNLDAYISAANRLPLLTQEEEVSLARRLREQGDLKAAGQLVLGNRKGKTRTRVFFGSTVTSAPASSSAAIRRKASNTCSAIW